MNFVLLWDQEQIDDARRRYPLFQPDCLPPHHGDEARYALITDKEQTVLGVLTRGSPSWAVRAHRSIGFPSGGGS